MNHVAPLKSNSSQISKSRTIYGVLGFWGFGVLGRHTLLIFQIDFFWNPIISCMIYQKFISDFSEQNFWNTINCIFAEQPIKQFTHSMISTIHQDCAQHQDCDGGAHEEVGPIVSFSTFNALSLLIIVVQWQYFPFTTIPIHNIWKSEAIQWKICKNFDHFPNIVLNFDPPSPPIGRKKITHISAQSCPFDRLGPWHPWPPPPFGKIYSNFSGKFWGFLRRISSLFLI